MPMEMNGKCASNARDSWDLPAEDAPFRRITSGIFISRPRCQRGSGPLAACELCRAALQKRCDALLVIFRTEAFGERSNMGGHMIRYVAFESVPDEILDPLERERR